MRQYILFAAACLCSYPAIAPTPSDNKAAANQPPWPWSLLGLWFGLAFAVDAHAFAIFLFVPFALAQLVRDFKRKKPDWPIWTALILFPIGILPVLHGELLAKKFTASTFGHSRISAHSSFHMGILVLGICFSSCLLRS
jgi:hypothetical protein